MSAAVLSYAGYAKTSGSKWGIPPAVLLGLTEVESGGDANAVSSAGARGATQFMPGTAPHYGVIFGSSPAAKASQIEGAAKYLHDLGFSKDPTRALASYNAGPGNWQAGLGYAKTVLARAANYKGLKGAGAAAVAPSASTPHQTAASDDSGSSLDSWGQQALHGLLWASLVGGGAVVALFGISRATGLRAKATA